MDELRFEGRDLKPFAEPVVAAGLVEGRVYFSLNYVDDEMMMPEMTPLVFVGRLDPDDRTFVFFQDLESHRSGLRSEESDATFYRGPELEVKHIFEFEHALDQLLACSLRRRARFSE